MKFYNHFSMDDYYIFSLFFIILWQINETLWFSQSLTTQRLRGVTCNSYCFKFLNLLVVMFCHYCLLMLNHLHILQLELEYCCVKSTNHRIGKSMRRVWVHGKFQKPFWCHSSQFRLFRYGLKGLCMLFHHHHCCF